MSAWLDVLPAIPLARGVPVVDVTRGVALAKWQPAAMRGLCVEVEQTGVCYWLWDDCDERECHTASCRVDLGDPQGFGYALRWQQTERRLRQREMVLDRGAILRWLNGETTDADRLDLARAIAEVY